MTVVHCTYDPSTKSGTPGAEARKVKGNIHWLAVDEAVPAQVRLYDRLFDVPFPGARNPHGERGRAASDAGRRAHAVRRCRRGRRRRRAVERNYLDDLNPASKRVDHRVRRAAARGGADRGTLPVRARRLLRRRSLRPRDRAAGVQPDGDAERGEGQVGLRSEGTKAERRRRTHAARAPLPRATLRRSNRRLAETP